MLLGGLFLLSVVSDAVSRFGKTAGSATIELVVAVLLGAIWLGLLWRVSRLGVYVGNGGLRYIGPLCTVIVPWSEVRGVRLAQWRPGGLLSFVPAQAVAIWIDRSDGAPVQTALTDKGAHFLGRLDAFERAFEAIRGEADRRASGG
jgi:hypothetical protein